VVKRLRTFQVLLVTF